MPLGAKDGYVEQLDTGLLLLADKLVNPDNDHQPVADVTWNHFLQPVLVVHQALLARHLGKRLLQAEVDHLYLLNWLSVLDL